MSRDARRAITLFKKMRDGGGKWGWNGGSEVEE